jgi:hypothetical protein
MTYDASDTAPNQSRPGKVIPTVRASARQINCERGNFLGPGLSGGASWLRRAIVRLFHSSFAGVFVKSTRPMKWRGKMSEKVE